jgi:ubiquinone/menaquinone biosynthesis C-methylase UbiE
MNSVPTKGATIKWARGYDLLVSAITFGFEGRFREKQLGLARLQPGERVLDVGCGTGTLAIAAKKHVGATGTVTGIDPAAEMVERAMRKAERASADVAFRTAAAEDLPFANGTFDVVLSSMMLHHLPKETRRAGVAEMKRVLKPGGRLLAIDFGRPSGAKRGFLAHIHGHGGVDTSALIALVSDAGFEVAASGWAGKWDLQYVLASAPQRT